MFETNADLKAMFSSLKHLKTPADLRASEMLETHALKVICVIDDTISNLDDMDYVIKLLQLTAHTHCRLFPHFDPEYLWVSVCGRPSFIGVGDGKGRGRGHVPPKYGKNIFRAIIM